MGSERTDYKSVFHLLCSVLLTGFGAWLVFGKDSVSRAELIIIEEKITKFEQLNHEKALLIERLNTRMDFAIETLKRIEAKVDK